MISGASAHVAGNEFPNLGARQGFIGRQQLVRRKQHSGCTEGTLRGVTGDELLLYARQLATLGEALDGIQKL